MHISNTAIRVTIVPVAITIFICAGTNKPSNGMLVTPQHIVFWTPRVHFHYNNVNKKNKNETYNRSARVQV